MRHFGLNDFTHRKSYRVDDPQAEWWDEVELPEPEQVSFGWLGAARVVWAVLIIAVVAAFALRQAWVLS